MSQSALTFLEARAEERQLLALIRRFRIVEHPAAELLRQEFRRHPQSPVSCWGLRAPRPLLPHSGAAGAEEQFDGRSREGLREALLVEGGVFGELSLGGSDAGEFAVLARSVAEGAEEEVDLVGVAVLVVDCPHVVGSEGRLPFYVGETGHRFGFL